MIYLEDKTALKYDFEELLSRTRHSILDSFNSRSDIEKLSGNEFENIVFENSLLASKGTSFENKLRHTTDREFPDIVAEKLFGIEVKATKKDNWQSIGNSILETSRVENIEKIYMFFGKLGGHPDIKYRNYEDCLKDITVTHYPRYKIDMLLPEGDSIFKKMNTTYDNLRSAMNPISLIRTYYKQQMNGGSALWWIDDDSDNMPALSPLIKNFSELSLKERDDIKAIIFCLFPEIFSTSINKFERIPAFLVSQFGVVSHNLRDYFTAGGQKFINYKHIDIKVPRIIFEFYQLRQKIRHVLLNTERTQLEEFWKISIKQSCDIETIYCNTLDQQREYLPKLSDLYRFGYL